MTLWTRTIAPAIPVLLWDGGRSRRLLRSGPLSVPTTAWQWSALRAHDCLAVASYAYYGGGVAKTRISISLEQDQAERIRQHAERAGMDVSAYLVHAATRQMAESDAIEEQFAEVDAVISQAEQAADVWPDEPAPQPAAQLTEQERREVEEALALAHGRDRQGHRPGHAA